MIRASSEAQGRGAIALWAVLAALALARALSPLAPSMDLWALNLNRFLSPPAIWIPSILAAAALIPPVARRAAPFLASLGDGLANGGLFAYACAALTLLVVAALLPDRVWFLGDFQLRQATLADPAGVLPFWYPYCLPLDLFLHDTLGRLLIHRFDWVENDYGRLLGAIEAALLGGFALRFTKALGVRGVPALLAWSTIGFSGALTLFTGYGKSFTEMTVLMVASGAFAIEIAQGRRSLTGLSLAVSLAFFLHRSALGFLPAYVIAAGVTLRDAGNKSGEVVKPVRNGMPRWRAALPTLAPAVALAIMGRTIFGIVRRTDAIHFAPPEVRHEGLLRATFTASRLTDLANIMILMCPLVIAALLVLVLDRRRPGTLRETMLLGALTLPFLLIAPFVHPTQGLMRDWDCFAVAGAGLSMLAAWILARALDGRRRLAWLGVAALLGVTTPCLTWLLHNTDRDRGLQRVEALLAGPPTRAAHERASAWEFLGLRRADLGDPFGAAAAFGHEAEIEPSPQVLRHWAVTEAMLGDLSYARAIYRDLVARFPTEAGAWFELAMLDARAGDRDAARHSVGEALRLNPSNTAAKEFLENLDKDSGESGP